MDKSRDDISKHDKFGVSQRDPYVNNAALHNPTYFHQGTSVICPLQSGTHAGTWNISLQLCMLINSLLIYYSVVTCTRCIDYHSVYSDTMHSYYFCRFELRLLRKIKMSPPLHTSWDFRGYQCFFGVFVTINSVNRVLYNIH